MRPGIRKCAHARRSAGWSAASAASAASATPSSCAVRWNFAIRSSNRSSSRTASSAPATCWATCSHSINAPSLIDEATDDRSSGLSGTFVTGHLFRKLHERAADRHVRGGNTRFAEGTRDFRVGVTELDARDDGLAVRRLQSLQGGLVARERLAADGLLDGRRSVGRPIAGERVGRAALRPADLVADPVEERGAEERLERAVVARLEGAEPLDDL